MSEISFETQPFLTSFEKINDQIVTLNKMTDQQKKFLTLNLINQCTYDQITKELGVPRKTLSLWYKELKFEIERIRVIRGLWKRKELGVNFDKFDNWYSSLIRKCSYCDITEAEINSLVDGGNLKTKRIKTRGRKLELDRKEPDLNYDLKNIVLSCYWCNNAKTDSFTYEEFLEVGKAFKQIWKARLAK